MPGVEHGGGGEVLAVRYMVNEDGKVGDERLVDVGVRGVVACGSVAFDAEAGAIQF